MLKNGKLLSKKKEEHSNLYNNKVIKIVNNIPQKNKEIVHIIEK